MLDSTFLDPHRVCIGLLPVTAFSIVLLAMIAAFLGMRLYSVLGKRTGHEQEPVLPRRDERVVPLPVRRDDADTPSAPRDAAADTSGLVYERSEEHTSELQSLMRISYAVFCLKKKNRILHNHPDI